MSSSSETYTPDSLLAGNQQPLVSEAATLAAGQNLTRGTVLGRNLRALGNADADAGNAGEGTIDDVAMGPKAKIGIYAITCIAAGPPAGFSVVDPDGIRLADAEAEVEYDGPIVFTIAAYGAAFEVDDAFTVEVEESTGYATAADSAGTGGSEDFFGVLAEDCDATDDAAPCAVYTGGEFNTDALVFGDEAETDTAETWRESARDRGIVFRTNL